MNKVVQLGSIAPHVNVKFDNQQPYRIYSSKGVSPALNTVGGGNREPKIQTDMSEKMNMPAELQGKKFRIRKLTPKECFRLMGVDDADIDTIQASGLSNSAQYKLAGNSIVVGVLFHLFRKMFIETDAENIRGNHTQLSLF